MKAIALHNIARARGKGTLLAVKSFTALAFDGTIVTAMPERPIPSDLAKTRLILLLSEDVVLGRRVRSMLHDDASPPSFLRNC